MFSPNMEQYKDKNLVYSMVAFIEVVVLKKRWFLEVTIGKLERAQQLERMNLLMGMRSAKD